MDILIQTEILNTFQIFSQYFKYFLVNEMLMDEVGVHSGEISIVGHFFGLMSIVGHIIG